MSDNEYWYNYYRQKYYDSCTNVRICENNIYSLRSQRSQTVNRVNQLNADIKNINDVISDITKVINCEENLNTKIADVANKTNEASLNFSGMVSSSDVNNKSLNDVYSAELTTTKNTLTNVMNTVKSKKNSLVQTLSSYQTSLNQANNSLESLDNSIRNENSNLGYWKQERTNCYYNMEYYKRKIQY